jgi:hypothetical protein
LPYYDEFEESSHDTNRFSTKYDLIIPTGAKSTYSEIMSRGPITVGEIVFNKENLIVFDKIKMLDIVNKIDIPIPKTFTNVEQSVEFPLFYKEMFECGGGVRGILNSKEDIPQILNEKNLIFQEYIDSPITYGVGFLAREGEIITSFIHKELLSYPRTGGSGVVLMQYDEQRLLEYTKKILNHINYSGWGLAEFKYCSKRNNYVFMEVNAKFWASIEFAFLNNSMFLKKMFGIDYIESKKPGIIYMDRLAEYGLGDYLQTYLKYRDFYRVNTKKSLRTLFVYHTKKINKILNIK